MSRLKLEEKHPNDTKKILILGSGFAGIEVLKELQKKFKDNRNIDITLVSRDNFLLFTPMRPEVATVSGSDNTIDPGVSKPFIYSSGAELVRISSHLGNQHYY